MYRDPAFKIWSNQFNKKYEVRGHFWQFAAFQLVLELIYITNLLQVHPIKEYEYCFRIAEEGGHQHYKDAIFPDVDDKRDAGQAGMSVPAFMQKYLDALIALMESVHAANLTICTDMVLDSEKDLLCDKWEHIIGTHQAAAKLLNEETEYLKAYQDLRKLLIQYNVHVGQSKTEDLQLLVVNELQALEVVCIRLYSGPMYKRY